MPYDNIYTGQIDAVSDYIASMTRFQSWVGAASAADAGASIFRYYYPENRLCSRTNKIAFVTLGQNHISEMTHIGSADRPFQRQGDIVVMFKEWFDRTSSAASYFESVTEGFLGSVGDMQVELEQAQRIPATPSDIYFMSVETQGWWRPDEEESRTQGDFLEWWAVIGYARDI